MTTSINIEGINRDKETLLAEICKEHACDILLVQETHRGNDRCRPKVEGMDLIVERPHNQYGSAIFARPGTNIISASLTDTDDIEILTVETPQYCVTSIYKPPNVPFAFDKPANFKKQRPNFILGDFNCKSTAWGYRETDNNGADLESWAETHDFQLIHDPKLPSSFNSGRWKRGYNPDNIFVSSRLAAMCSKHMGEPIPKTQHRPIICIASAILEPEQVPFKRRFNFKKAEWNRFKENLDAEVREITPQPENYESFIELVRKISRKCIPRGCRTQYIAGLTKDTKPLLNRYQKLFEKDPFAEDTVEAGEDLMRSIADGRTQKWRNMMENLDMKVNSRRAWKLLKNLSGDPKKTKENFTEVTADQVATQLLRNGKIRGRQSRQPLVRDEKNEDQYLREPFSMDELNTAVKDMKINKAPGIDDLRTEQIKNFGDITLQWLLKLFNTCVTDLKLPNMWRKARVIALLKPGKDSKDPKSYRPVSLLCHLYKLFERLILNRINAILQERLIPQQAGFRPGKSCCGQILNLTQFIEDGFEERRITGTVFIDLTAAYDTVNHRKLLTKTYEITRDFHLTRMIGTLLQNRRFQVSLMGKSSRWRNQKNGLPQGSVLAPTLYNIYTNDQPLPANTRQFIYADDTAVAAQGKSFEEVEAKLSEALEELSAYYDSNHLRSNPSKTQICAFHLNNKYAKRELNIVWRGIQLQHFQAPKYLGVTLDRTLCFKQHCINTRAKVSARNNILRKLTNRFWGADPQTLRTSALALCVSAAEYAAPVWSASKHAKHVDTAVNETARIVTGCLKPTPVQKLYPLIGIAPPHIRREVATNIERKKQQNDQRHPLHGHQPPNKRLRSRKSFLFRTKELEGTAEKNRTDEWREELGREQNVNEEIASGSQCPYPVWRTLNRMRVGVPRCRTNMAKWGLLPDNEDTRCDCGAIQDPNHLLVCPMLKQPCSMEDLLIGNDKAIAAANYWKMSV